MGKSYINPMELILSVIDIKNPALAVDNAGRFVDQPEGLWSSLAAELAATKLAEAARSVCRIRISFKGSVDSFGTGFVCGDGLLVTNSHVVDGIYGNYDSFVKGHKLQTDFKLEISFDADGEAFGNPFDVTERMVCKGRDLNGKPDVAMLRVPLAATHGRKPLALPDFALPVAGYDGAVAVVGYPARLDDPSHGSNETSVFKPGFTVSKRVSPGQYFGSKPITGQLGAQHCCSTLKGSSGSPVLRLDTFELVAIHYYGDENQSSTFNRAVPVKDLGAFIELCRSRLSDPGALALSQGIGPTSGGKQEPAALLRDSFGVLPDPRDFRDLPYNPPLIRLPQEKSLPANVPRKVLNQELTPHCTGFALAHLVSVLEGSRKKEDVPSARMAYEMARIHDEVAGRATKGATLRGVIKGFHHNGLARFSEQYDKVAEGGWNFVRQMIGQARSTSLGAYYRLSPRITDYQAAIAETGAILVSAKVHDGWVKPERGKITFPHKQKNLAHAFVIVGYNDEGFIVLNSAGEKWSTYRKAKGRALWSYADWAENVLDGWVLRLAAKSPKAFGQTARSLISAAAADNGRTLAFEPRRHNVLGHCLMSRDGALADFGRYATNLAGVGETADHLKDPESREIYQNLLFVVHGEICSEDDVLRWITATKPCFKANGIYPVSIHCEPDYALAFAQLLAGAKAEAARQLPLTDAGYPELVLNMLSKFGHKLHQSWQSDIGVAFGPKGEGAMAIGKLAAAAAGGKDMDALGIHVACHLGGCFALDPLLKAIDHRVDSIQLVAPEFGHFKVPDIVARPRRSGPRVFNYSFIPDGSVSRWSVGGSLNWLDVVESWRRESEGYCIGRAGPDTAYYRSITTRYNQIGNANAAPETALGEAALVSRMIANVQCREAPEFPVPADALDGLGFLAALKP